MSKKSKKSRSAFTLEALEQRQLLATIVAGSGENVADAQNVKLANGNTYDQVLMTGATVTVGADAGQITRVDFLDADGDITRVEFSGAGQLTVSLADFKEAAAPANYVSTVKYVQGDASFRITGSDATTNVTIYSLGQLNVNGGLTNPIFGDGTKLGGNHFANVNRLVIEADNSALGSAFGGIRAANAQFSGATGAVGIVAPDVQFQGPIIVGDIDATGNALPVLQIGQFSANKTVQIAGGDLKVTNGAAFITSNVAKLTVSSGQNSNADLLSTTPLVNTLGVAAADISYTSSATKVVVDGKTVTDAQLADYAKMYLNEVELTNWTSGKVFKAHLIGKVTVTGDLGGTITTDVDGKADSSADEFGIGDVTITGKLLGTGKITSATSVGNVTVTGGIDLSSGDAGVSGLITTIGRAGQSAKIGDVSFGADVKLDADNVTVLSSATSGAGTGGIGKITGAGLLSATGANNDVFKAATGSIGAISFTKTISVAGAGAFANAVAGSVGDISGTAVTLTDVIAGGTGKVGNINATDGALSLDVVSAQKGIGAITATKAVTLAGDVTTTEGNIGNITAGGNLAINEDLTAVAGTIGNITANGGTLTLGDAATDVITAKSIGNIGVTGDDKGIAVSSIVTATDSSIGTISVGGVKANLDLSAGGNFIAKGSIGDITVAGGRIIGANDGGEAEFLANKIGNISVTAHKDQAAGALLSDVSFVATVTNAGTDAGKTSAKAASIGNITIDASAKTGAAIASGAASTDKNLGTGFSSSGNIGDVTFKASETGKLLAAATGSLVVRAGNANMAGDADTGAAGVDTFADGVNTDGGVSIGKLTINADLSGLSDGTAGTGLIVASGVSTTDGNGGIFVVGTAANAAVTTPATKLGAGGTIGAVTINNYDAVTGTDVRGFANSTVLSGSTTAFAAGATIIADGIASVDVATAVEVKHYAPTGQPLKGAIGLGGNTAATGGADDLFVIVV